MQGRYDEALADLTKAIELDGEDVFALTSRGETYGMQGRYDEALDDFNAAIALGGGSGSLCFLYRGVTHGMQGRYDEALNDFNTALARDGSVVLDDLNKNIALDGNNVFALISRGVRYRLLGLDDEALDDLNRAIVLDNNNVFALLNRGETYRMLGQHNKALDDFNQVIKLDGNNAWAIGKRGQTYQAMGKNEEALADFKIALALDSSSDWIRRAHDEVDRQQSGRTQMTDESRVSEWEEEMRQQTRSGGESSSQMEHLLKRAQSLIEQEMKPKEDRARQEGNPARGQLEAAEEMREPLKDEEGSIRKRYEYFLHNLSF
jgi:tetratricopeptide (TPR) repeat protein